MNTKIESIPLFFSSRWAGGISFILGPLLLLAGVLLRVQFHFFYPGQLAAYAEHPSLMTASYSLFAAGNVVMVPAVLTLAGQIRGQKPFLAFWGGFMVISGLVARTFHAGVDHLAFQLAASGSVATATEVMDRTYGAFHIFRIFNLAIMLGWMVLATGAYRSRVLPLYGAVALGLTSALPLGVLKGTTPFSIVAAAGLCTALVPLGFRLMRSGPVPPWQKVMFYCLLTAATGAIFYFVGQQG